MRIVLLTSLLIGGSALATASCTELPPDSGCFYNTIDGHLMPASAAGCPEQASSLWWTWWLYGRQPDPYESSTTTTVPVGGVAPSAPAAAPVSTDPVPSMPEPAGSVSTTTTTTTLAGAAATDTTSTIATAPPG